MARSEKGQSLPFLSENADAKRLWNKARNTSQPRKKKVATNEADMDVDTSAPEETAIPPRRRIKARDPNPASFPDTEETSSRPARKAQEQARKNQIWMKPEAGCPKGKGATAANEARKRALSVAEEEAQKKRAKAANGDSIPEPSLESDDDQNFGWMDIEEHHAVVKTKRPPAKRPKAPSRKEPSAESKVPQPAAKRIAKVSEISTSSRGSTAAPSRPKPQKRVIEVKYSPPALDEPSSDECLDVEGEGSQDDDGGSDDDDGNGRINDTQFMTEQVTVLAKPSKVKPAASLFDDDEEGVYDHAAEVMKGSSPPPGSDAEMGLSEDSGSEPELVRPKAPVTKPQAAPVPNKTPKAKFSASVDVSKPKVKTSLKVEKGKTPSKREEVHRKEQPVILQKAKGRTVPTNAREWSAEATAVANKANEYNLNDQPPVLKTVLSRSILVAHKYVIFTTLFPGYATPATFMRNLLLQAAKDIAKQDGTDEDTKKYATEIFERFRSDSVFVSQLTDLPMTRITQFRAGSKSVAKSIIDMHYGFTPNLSRSQVKALASAELAGNKYVYERTPSGAADISTIYQHSAVKGVLQEWLFKKHGQMGRKLKRHFINLGQERSDEFEDVPTNDGELSIPVVAAAAAALQSVLQDKQSFNKGGRFDVNVIEDEYAKHIRTLEAIRGEKPSRFHELMNKLFLFASTGEGATDILAFDFGDNDSVRENGDQPRAQEEKESETKEGLQNGTVATVDVQVRGGLIYEAEDDAAGGDDVAGGDDAAGGDAVEEEE
ncbi:hypothetical protein V5O48_011696 [Marasmius crinis-equi]|uniref:DUF6532 domain-containing protein n=1 Tax=Marasmius crinis-equi TaxID=585013 RepID=A0ABR3F588_9AGAR